MIFSLAALQVQAFLTIAPLSRVSPFLIVKDSLWYISWVSRSKLKSFSCSKRRDIPTHTCTSAPVVLADEHSAGTYYISLSKPSTCQLAHFVASQPLTMLQTETNSLWCPGPDEVHMRISNKAFALFLNNLRRIQGGRRDHFLRLVFLHKQKEKPKTQGETQWNREKQTLRRRQEDRTQNGCKA